MKLTWFGKATFRVHVGGAIVVVEPDAADPTIDRGELVSGTDRLVMFDGVEPLVAASWKPRAPLRPLETDEQNRQPDIVAFDSDTLAIDADGEAPLVICRGDVPGVAKWVERGVVVIAGASLSARVSALIAERSPRLIALAGDDSEVDSAFEALRDHMGSTGLVALECALAVEV